jgi:hypothetical protein
MEKHEARRLLPKVGDQRMERPTIDETTSTKGTLTATRAQRCVVVEVNEAHLWYTVQFENGIRESYKVPKCKPPYGGGL